MDQSGQVSGVGTCVCTNDQRLVDVTVTVSIYVNPIASSSLTLRQRSMCLHQSDKQWFTDVRLKKSAYINKQSFTDVTIQKSVPTSISSGSLTLCCIVLCLEDYNYQKGMGVNFKIKSSIPLQPNLPLQQTCGDWAASQSQPERSPNMNSDTSHKHHLPRSKFVQV